MRFSFTVILALVLFLAVPSFAQDADKTQTVPSTMQIERASTLAAPVQVPTAGVFMVLTNNAAAPDRLVGADSAAADGVELVSLSVGDDGRMALNRVDAIDVPAGEPLVLGMGGSSLLMTGVKSQFKTGEKFPMNLKFEHAGTVPVNVEVIDPQEMTKRFSPQTMEGVMRKLRTIQENREKAENPSFLDRLRNKVRSLLGRAPENTPGVTKTMPALPADAAMQAPVHIDPNAIDPKKTPGPLPEGPMSTPDGVIPGTLPPAPQPSIGNPTDMEALPVPTVESIRATSGAVVPPSPPISARLPDGPQPGVPVKSGE
ncbi:MAG: copper chaperone PCu(A)C [Rhodospirillales bacterium]|nr:copper chaperone PCu(A)C [Alphaproteobacteria bacterium]MCB9986452.1 copper chaperone PCu(A)C [Rhodospirillales bacterium]USO07002.1 MAG: copper chaperone PCu(A)C [Rhodospirillales bacterium]